MIRFSGVSFHYPQHSDILSDISFEIQAGEYVAIAGMNGMGKSTVGKLMNGLLLPTKGEIRYQGRCTSDERELGMIRDKIGMVFQNPENQIVASTVFEDIAFGLQNNCLPPEEISARVIHTLELVGMLDYIDADVNSLSGGQKQRIAIAGILAVEPEAIIFDESTSMLDPEGKEQVLGLIRELNRKGITIISITHDMEELVEASRVIVLDQSGIRYDGPPASLFEEAYLSIPGLAAPFAVSMREALRSKGLPLPNTLFRMEELVECLWKLH
ncbi:energy-coupling factor transporter ATPase [Paenibacillus ihumii]|uniref:energy-coupling factor transporter ATPase n=1 Tax=Paenibacillus ihumii TaxID=687436 RepID=UPI0006D76C05|nr:energy-coupling factor transporter ATPase [Paenibacillus ihumii]